MIVLYIIGGLILLIILLLLMRVKLTVSYKKDTGKEGDLLVYATVGPVRIKLLPSKKKKLRLSDYSAENFRKMMALSSESESNSVTKTDSLKKQKEKLLSGGFFETFDLVRDLLEKFSHHIRCEVIRIKMFAGTKDAALTAYAYTVTASAVDLILRLIDEHAVLRLRSRKDVFVEADFKSGEFYGNVVIKFSIRVINVLSAGFDFIKDHGKIMTLTGHKK